MARKMKILALGAFVLFSLTGCGKKTGTEEAALTTSNTLSYHAIDNGCDTGIHSFSSLDDLCAALKNEALNHYCAVAQRQKWFQEKGCTGTF